LLFFVVSQQSEKQPMIRKFATQTFKDKTDAISAVFILSPPQFSIQQGFFPLWKNLRRFL